VRSSPSKRRPSKKTKPGEAGPPPDPRAEDPRAEDPSAEDPRAEDPSAEDPSAEDPRADDPGADDPHADELSAELATAYWAAYRDRMATIGFRAMARQFPGLVAQAVRLGWEASRWDTVATIAASLASGVFTGYALLASTSVLQALFAAGPTPGRVRAAIPSLLVVAAAVAARSGLQAAAGWSQARLEPQIHRVVETRLFELTTRVQLSAFDDAEFNDAMLRARDRGVMSAAVVVETVLDCLTGAVGIASAAVVVSVLNPILLAVLVAAELPGGWAAVRSARIGYATNFALADSRRRKWILSDLMALRRTAAEVRSFTFAPFLLARFRQLVAYERDAELVAARRQALTRVAANAAGGVATAGVYVVLGALLAVGTVPLAVAGTAVLAIRSAQASLAQLLYAVNRCYEEGLYFSDYLAFCTRAAGLSPARGGRAAPAEFDRITAERVTFAYPGAAEPALHEVSIDIRRGQVVALVGENGSGKTTLAKLLAGADLVIGDLPRGYRTLLDRQFKDGVELSGGQWQRIAVARGFYRAAPLLIMDEPTAALDARAEYALFSSFREHARGRSVLIITHRLASVRQADRVYVLHDGRVTEQGTHGELLARRGRYAELYTLQASQYDPAPG
jgi:ABC-type multidrug transport system fused ATPase/permease subunit